MPEVLIPPGADVRRDFKVHSNAALKAIKRAIDLADGSKGDALYLEGIASSTVRDRHGDTITARGQAMMLEKAQRLTMWLNHSYDVPEDILGTCEESDLVAGSGDLLDLTIRCKIETTNPRAVQAWKAVENGTQLGFSIGGAITECEIDEENDDGTSWCPPLVIDGIDLYEISLVGIPANPRAYTRDFVHEMSRGFMRNAARNPEVRKHLREVLPALRTRAGDGVVHTAIEMIADGVTRTVVLGSGSPEVATSQTLDEMRILANLNLDGHTGTQAVKAILSFAKTFGLPIAFAKDAADGDGDNDGDGPELEPAVQASIAKAMGSLSAAMGHGMCSESMTNCQDAHECLKGLLAPDSDLGDDPDDQDVQVGKTASLTLDVDTAEAQQKLAALAEQTAAAQTHLDSIISETTQRAAELETAKAEVEVKSAEAKTLQSTIDQLKATPTGRQTAQAGGSYGRAKDGPRSLHDAQRNLGAAIAGIAVDDPAMRPA